MGCNMNRLLNTFRQYLYQTINVLDIRFNIILKYLKLIQVFSSHDYDYYSKCSLWYETSEPEAKASEKFNLSYVKASSSIFYRIPVEHRTYKICLAAIEQDPNLMSYVPLEHKTYELCSLAIENCDIKNFKSPMAYIPENIKTYIFCLRSVMKDPGSLEFIPKDIIDYRICKEAVSLGGEMIFHVPEEFQTEELNLLAIKQSWQAIRHIKEQTYEMCKIAVAQNPNAFSYITNHHHKTVDLALQVMNNDEGYRHHYKLIDICPNPDHKTTLSNLMKMKTKEDEIKSNKGLVLNTIKGLN